MEAQRVFASTAQNNGVAANSPQAELAAQPTHQLEMLVN